MTPFHSPFYKFDEEEDKELLPTIFDGIKTRLPWRTNEGNEEIDQFSKLFRAVPAFDVDKTRMSYLAMITRNLMVEEVGLFTDEALDIATRSLLDAAYRDKPIGDNDGIKRAEREQTRPGSEIPQTLFQHYKDPDHGVEVRRSALCDAIDFEDVSWAKPIIERAAKQSTDIFTDARRYGERKLHDDTFENPVQKSINCLRIYGDDWTTLNEEAWTHVNIATLIFKNSPNEAVIPIWTEGDRGFVETIRIFDSYLESSLVFEQYDPHLDETSSERAITHVVMDDVEEEEEEEETVHINEQYTVPRVTKTLFAAVIEIIRMAYEKGRESARSSVSDDATDAASEALLAMLEENLRALVEFETGGRPREILKEPIKKLADLMEFIKPRSSEGIVVNVIEDDES